MRKGSRSPAARSLSSALGVGVAWLINREPSTSKGSNNLVRCIVIFTSNAKSKAPTFFVRKIRENLLTNQSSTPKPEKVNKMTKSKHKQKEDREERW